MLIKITASPFSQDGDFPWEYEREGFLDWYDEVHREAYKKDIEPSNDIMMVIESVKAMGYTVEWEDGMYREQHVPFTREQLIFIVETSMASAFDMVHGSLPQSPSDVKALSGEKYKGLPDYRQGAKNTVAIFVPILWAQTEGKRIDDGMGTGDFPCWSDFEKRVDDFVEKQLAGDFRQPWPNFRDLAEKIVDECWSDYLQ